MNKNNRAILDIVFYIIVFFLIQLLFMYLVRFVEVWISENSLRYALFALKGGPILTGKMLATASIHGASGRQYRALGLEQSHGLYSFG